MRYLTALTIRLQRRMNNWVSIAVGIAAIFAVVFPVLTVLWKVNNKWIQIQQEIINTNKNLEKLARETDRRLRWLETNIWVNRRRP